MLDSYASIFDFKPKSSHHSPIEKSDHPELDALNFLDADSVQQCQSLIGALQWTVPLGRIDVTTAVMTMSYFRAKPRSGHKERLKRSMDESASENVGPYDSVLKNQIYQPCLMCAMIRKRRYMEIFDKYFL